MTFSTAAATCRRTWTRPATRSTPIARWYAQRNVNIPCPTRVQHDADWDAYLVGAVRASGAEAVIHLLPKFCEPHMLYYPELRKGLDAAGIPQLLLETEHEGLPGRVVPDPRRGAGRARPAQAAGIRLRKEPPMDATQDRSNRLSVTRAGGQLITDYWDDLFTAREQGKQIVWYNGGALNPFFQAAGLAWCHGEAFAARLAAQRLEGPAQLAGAEYGYNAELCSYARTHLGCSVLTLQSSRGRA